MNWHELKWSNKAYSSNLLSNHIKPRCYSSKPFKIIDRRRRRESFLPLTSPSATSRLWPRPSWRSLRPSINFRSLMINGRCYHMHIAAITHCRRVNCDSLVPFSRRRRRPPVLTTTRFSTWTFWRRHSRPVATQQQAKTLAFAASVRYECQPQTTLCTIVQPDNSLILKFSSVYSCASP